MATGILTRLIVTQAGIFTSSRSTKPFGIASLLRRTLSYRSFEPTASALCLFPIIIGAEFLVQ
jgi:hypothetical protein